MLQEVLLPLCREFGITEPGQLTSRALGGLYSRLVDGTGSRSGRLLSSSSVASYARTIKAFLEWLAERSEIGGSHAAKPRLPRRVVDALPSEDIRALEDAAATERDKLIVRLLAGGVRLGELLTADPVREAPGRRRHLKVRGKSGERMVPIQPGLVARIERYERQTRRGSPGSALFLGNRRCPTTGEYVPLTASEATQLIRELGQKALKRPVHPHLLRRSFPTQQRRPGDA